jgi:hypothetical protein
MAQPTLNPIPGDGVAHAPGYHESNKDPVARVTIGMQDQSGSSNSEA